MSIGVTDSVPAETRRDGGKWALSGFFYQTVGVAGVVARAHNRHEQGLDSDGLDALVEVYGLVPESFYDQDAVLIPLNGMNEGRCAFYQFKYAQSTNNTMLTAPAFLDIVAAFVKGARSALSEGRTVFKYILVTNRVVSRTVLKWIEDGELPATKAAEVVCLVYGERENGISETEQAQISAEVTAVMSLFSLPVQKTTLSYLWRELTSYGERLGLSRDLLSDGIRNLIATQVINDPEGVGDPIDKSALNRAFCGCDDPRELTVERIKGQHSAAVVETFCVVPELGEPVLRRNIENWLIERMDEGCLIFVLTGVGGMGKSTTLARWIEQYLVTRDGIILFAAHSSRLKRGWLGEKVHGWSRIPRLNGIGTGTAVRCLKSANQGREISIVIVVDGLDEVASSDNSELYGAIAEFTDLQNNGEPLTIIATSRNDQPLRDMFGIPPKELGGVVGIPLYLVSEFGADEFESLIRSGDDSETKRRLLRSVLSSMGGMDDVGIGMIGMPSIYGDAVGDTPPKDVAVDIIDCLKIPIIWGRFAGLSEQHKNMFLDKELVALQEVGNGFIEWFHWKLTVRAGDDLFDKLDLQDLLQLIAVQTGEQNIHQRESWIRFSTEKEMDRSKAVRLYKEAGSAGLITSDEDGRQWRWTSPIIRDCIASLARVSS